MVVQIRRVVVVVVGFNVSYMMHEKVECGAVHGGAICLVTWY